VAELVVALDLPTGKEALQLVDRLPGLGWAKVGPVLFVAEGPTVVRELTRRGIAVFLDLKWHDIPSTVGHAVSAARDLGVSLATVHCLGGSAMLTAAAKAAGDMALVGVTVLTSHDGPGLTEVLGTSGDVGTQVERLARLAQQSGLRGVVGSGQEVRRLRSLLGPAAWIVVPGIRAPGDEAGDQARTVSPADAVKSGASHVVVGRPITAAADPANAYRTFQDAMGYNLRP
jgi:orotidine-5'-phosphate decarboxylase